MQQPLIIEPHTLTPEQYLQAERKAIRELTGKHELINGQLIAMSGASLIHNLISMNIIFLLGKVRRQKNLTVFSGDMRVNNPLNDSFCYPDVCVVSGAPQMSDAQKDVLLNPVLVVEVLSPTTERYDRSEKLKIYLSIPSVQEYLLVSQEQIGLESYYKTEEGKWIYTEITQHTDTLLLQSIGLTLSAEAVYEGVTFEVGK